MPNYLTDIAIVLRVTDFSETSQIVGLLTRVHGLMPLIAKGAKRTSKKNTMSGPLDLLTTGEVVFIPPKETVGFTAGTNTQRGGAGGGTGLGTLAAWELADHRRELRSTLAGLNAGMLCAEVTTHLVQPQDPHPDLFDELLATLGLLSQGSQRARAAVAYLKALLVAAGYWPQFGACLACGTVPMPGDGNVRFSPRAGGIICASGAACHVDHAGPTTLLPARLAVALDRLAPPTALQANPPERPADDQALAAALQLLLSQVEAITDKQLRTRYLAATITGA